MQGVLKKLSALGLGNIMQNMITEHSKGGGGRGVDVLTAVGERLRLSDFKTQG